MATKRVGFASASAAFLATIPTAGIIASRYGSAMAAPAPFRNVRRGMAFPLRIFMVSFSLGIGWLLHRQPQQQQTESWLTSTCPVRHRRRPPDPLGGTGML